MLLHHETMIRTSIISFINYQKLHTFQNWLITMTWNINLYKDCTLNIVYTLCHRGTEIPITDTTSNRSKNSCLIQIWIFLIICLSQCSTVYWPRNEHTDNCNCHMQNQPVIYPVARTILWDISLESKLKWNIQLHQDLHIIDLNRDWRIVWGLYNKDTSPLIWQ
jgi:hypothetical protein